MNNQCRIHAVETASLFCQLLREPEEIQNHGLHAARQPDVRETREMVLSAYERTWTFGLCSLCIFCNMVAVKSLNTNKKKESFFVSDDKVFQKHYRFEDFFWTGSGDGPVTEELFTNNTDPGINVVEASPFETWRTTTVFHTTTILFATVYSNSEGCIKFGGCKPEISPVQTGSIDYSLPTFPHSKVPDILPSPTQTLPHTNTLPDDYFLEEGVGVDANAFGAPPTSLATPKPPSPAKPTIFTSIGANESAFPKTDLEALNVTTTTVFPAIHVDQKYWITTVLRNDNYSPTIELNSTENKLSTLYRKAFNRRQEKYAGGIDRRVVEPVKVHILNVSCEGNSMEIIYSVTVAGNPVPAISAANDMRLLTASEVIAELGHPILTKAEPYMKGVIPLGARVKGRTRDTWLFIGSVIAAVLLLIILAGLFAVGLSKKRTRRSAAKGMNNRKKVFEEEAGSSNLGFEEETDSKTKSASTRKAHSKSGDSKTPGESTGTTVKFTEERRESTTSSSCSGSSEASLVRLRYQQKRKEKKKGEMEDVPRPKPRTRMRRIESYDCSKNLKKHGYIQSAGSGVSKNTFEEMTTEGYDDLDYSPRMTKSPTSYLSMPSVRAFPRGTNIPEPLNKILEPTSIRHLDADSDSPSEIPHGVRERHQEIDVEQVCEVKNKFVKRKALTRHASLEGDDPGFIGPVVWNRHCQKINEGASGRLNIEVVDENVNVGRMRKRFNELLDDALSMFGSRNGSPEGSVVVPARQLDNRVHSAIVRPAGVAAEEAAVGRPKTTGSKRPQSSVISGPRGAWETPSCSTLARPVSAGAFRQSSPLIDKNLIYVNSDLPPGDPAIPLIAAIKNELKKFEDPAGNA